MNVDDSCSSESGARQRTNASHLCLPQDPTVLLQSQFVRLLLEHLPGPFKYHLEALLACLCVLLEAIDSELLDAVLNLLPPSAECCDLCPLGETCLVQWRCGVGCVDAGFADLKQVGPGDVHRAHGKLLGNGVHVRRLVDHRSIHTAKDGGYPFWR